MALQFCHALGHFGPAIHQQVRKALASGHQIHWFTDGSCQEPHLPVGRYSAYSVILDLCECNAERIGMARAHQHSATIPASLTVACVGRTPGEQDILRAEITAIVLILKHFGVGIVHTDSSVAVNYFNQFFAASSWSDLEHLEHLDLFASIWHLRPEIVATVVKVKAHTDLETYNDMLDLYFAFGNKLANDSAITTCHQYQFSLVTQYRACALQIANERKRLRRVFDLHLALKEVQKKAQLAELTPATTVPEVHDAFANWRVDDALVFTDEVDGEHIVFSAWGAEALQQTLQWLQLFQWPREPVGPLGHQCGVSWAELALSWMFYNRSYLPIRRFTVEGTDVILTPANFFKAKEWRVTLTEMGSSCQHLFEHLRALIPTTVTPQISTGKVSSLYIRGCGAFHQGIRTRPVFPCQVEVSKFIQNMLVAGKVKLIELTPDISTDRVDDLLLDRLSRKGKDVLASR